MLYVFINFHKLLTTKKQNLPIHASLRKIVHPCFEWSHVFLFVVCTTSANFSLNFFLHRKRLLWSPWKENDSGAFKIFLDLMQKEQPYNEAYHYFPAKQTLHELRSQNNYIFWRRCPGSYRLHDFTRSISITQEVDYLLSQGSHAIFQLFKYFPA
jgi:hypothetical protein